MTINYLTDFSNDALLVEADRLAAQSRHTTTALIRVLIEVERRRLHLSLGHSSLFTYCTGRLCLSEAAAYSRITAARWAQQFPTVLDYVDDGSLTLSGLNRLAAVLTLGNGQRLLAAARFKSTREIERLVADLRAEPGLSTIVRALPATIRALPATIRALPTTARAMSARTIAGASTTTGSLLDAGPAEDVAPGHSNADVDAGIPVSSIASHVHEPIRPASAPVVADRFLLRVAISKDTHDKLERLRALMRHRNPAGDIATILDEALTLLLARVERERCGKLTRRSPAALPANGQTVTPADPQPPSSGKPRVSPRPSRHIPASIRRAIWARDGGRCAFVGPDGRCGETAFLEIHHLHPFAVGGATTVENLALRCRAHNGFEALAFFCEGLSLQSR